MPQTSVSHRLNDAHIHTTSNKILIVIVSSSHRRFQNNTVISIVFGPKHFRIQLIGFELEMATFSEQHDYDDDDKAEAEENDEENGEGNRTGFDVHRYRNARNCFGASKLEMKSKLDVSFF